MEVEIQHETQKISELSIRIEQLKARISQKKQNVEEKKARLRQLQNLAQVQREKLQKIPKSQIEKLETENKQYVNPVNLEGLNTATQSASRSTGNSSNANFLHILNQLKEHFRALKDTNEWSDLDDEESYEDEVDIDNMTYEELLELGQKIGTVSKGLGEENLNKLKSKPVNMAQLNNTTCPICYDTFQEGQEYIELACSHLYHKNCLYQWLKMEKQCPSCKKEIMVPQS